MLVLGSTERTGRRLRDRGGGDDSTGTARSHLLPRVSAHRLLDLFTNVMARSEDPALQDIIRKLKALGCDVLETLEPQWVHSVLVSPGRPRYNLLRWVMARLAPSEYSNLYSAPSHAQEQKSKEILQILVCMGICRPGDKDIIEGSAPEKTQVKFWRTCLDVIEHLQDFCQPGNKERIDPQMASRLLSQLAHSAHLLPTLKEEVSLVPDDLMDKYHAWCKQQKQTPESALLSQEGEVSLVPDDFKDKDHAWCKQQKHTLVSESLRRVKEQLRQKQEEHKHLEKCGTIPSAEEHQSLQASVERAVSSLTREQEVLRGAFSTYMAPWTTTTTQLELPDTGLLVKEADASFSNLFKTLKTTEEILEGCDKLQDQKAILRVEQHPPSIATALRSLGAEAGRQPEC